LTLQKIISSYPFLSNLRNVARNVLRSSPICNKCVRSCTRHMVARDTNSRHSAHGIFPLPAALVRFGRLSREDTPRSPIRTQSFSVSDVALRRCKGRSTERRRGARARARARFLATGCQGPRGPHAVPAYAASSWVATVTS